MANAMTAVLREGRGKGPARAERRAGRVLGVIYGGERPPVPVSVEPTTLQRDLAAGALYSTVYDIEVGGEHERVLPREVQFDPVTDRVLHVDFLRVTASTSLAVDVPCIFLNEEESPGLKRGGVLNVVRRSLELMCQVNNIPQQIEIDLTGLEIGDGIHISMITLPDGTTSTITDRDFTIATVAAPTVVAEETAAEELEEGEEGLEGEDGEATEEEADADSKDGEDKGEGEG